MKIRTAHERLLRSLKQLGPGGLRYVERRFDQIGLEREVTYTSDDGKTNVIRLMIQPSILSGDQLTALARMTETFNRAFVDVVGWWPGSPELQTIMPLEPEEKEWIALAPPLREAAGARWDVSVDPLRPGRAGEARLFEMNGCAVGGIHYSSAVMDILIDAERPLFEGYRLVPSRPMNELWRAILGTAPGRFLWLEDREWTLGTMEGPPLCAFADTAGGGSAIADPRDVALRGHDVVDGAGRAVGRMWRNMELRDIVRLEQEEGRPLAGLREAVRRGMVFGPLQQDLDHKSLLEVWSTRAWLDRFDPARRAVLKRHVPWTRLCSERRVEGPDGRQVDLPEYARRKRKELVFKPNRGCGGEGVLIGGETRPAAWERAIARSVSGAEPGVVQELVDTAVLPSPVVRGGKVAVERFFLTYGLMQVGDSVGILGRASPNRVVNVAQGGGLAAVVELQ
jgi:hypothetical protein